MSVPNMPNKSTFMFSNMDDHEAVIDFKLDERDHNQLFNKLLFVPIGGGLINGLLPFKHPKIS